MLEQELFAKAVAFAAEKHSRQIRKDGTPYIWHLLKVAELLKEAGYDYHYQIAAVLHDTLEDTDATEEEIKEFGEDVFQAVRLVTRLDGMDEDEYVSAILENHMAAAVKNADKIHNMWDVKQCKDTEWARHYTEKVKKHYWRKFSKALDKAILNAPIRVVRKEKVGEFPFYTQEEMMLYSDRAVLRYRRAKKCYMENTSYPDFNDPNMRYWYNELFKYYFCFSEQGIYWILGSAGWLPTKENPLWEDEYGTYMCELDKNKVKEYIEKKKKEDYFYDFVDLGKVQID